MIKTDMLTRLSIIMRPEGKQFSCIQYVIIVFNLVFKTRLNKFQFLITNEDVIIVIKYSTLNFFKLGIIDRNSIYKEM